MLLTFPLMAAIQEISARVGRVTGHGIAGNVCRHYSMLLLNVVVALLFIANTINIAADLGAMADATKLLIGGPGIVYVLVFGVVSVVAQIFLDYKRYVSVLKWLTLSLFAYVGALAFAHISWREALGGILIPRITWSARLFHHHRRDLRHHDLALSVFLAGLAGSRGPARRCHQAAADRQALRRAKGIPSHPRRYHGRHGVLEPDRAVDHLHRRGDAACRRQDRYPDLGAGRRSAAPIAGAFAEVIFALGIVGTGLLAIPVLAGATAYAVGEGRQWPVGLARKPKEAVAFYAVLALSAAIGIALNFTSINPISALYWSAVVNGVLAVPVMVLLMIMARRKDVMGHFTIGGPLYWLGWLSTAAMLLSVVAMVAGYFCHLRSEQRASKDDSSSIAALHPVRIIGILILAEHDRRHPSGHQRHERRDQAIDQSRSGGRWWRRTARSRP